MALSAGCSGDPPDFVVAWELNTSRVRTSYVTNLGVDGQTVKHQRPHLLDSFGRYVTFHGINLSGSNKFPHTEQFPDVGDEVSYVGKPFPAEDADHYFSRLAALGFNSVRLLAIWEGIEPYAKGEYDEAYLDYYEEMIRVAGEHGLYVLVDMHQDLFSRHLYAYYNEETPAERGSMEDMILSLVPRLDQDPSYSDWLRGDGAPRWAVEAVMPEKDLDSPHWGQFRLLGSLEPAIVQAILAEENVAEVAEDLGIPQEIALETVEILNDLVAVYTTFDPLEEGAGLDDLPPWVAHLAANLPGRFEPHETCDQLPWTFWGVNHVLSIDVERCYAALFGGDMVFPDLVAPDGGDIKTYLQEAYAGAFVQLARRAKKYDNVIGYDVMNEPGGLYIMLTLAAATATLNDPDAIGGLLADLLGEELGGKVHSLATGLRLIPPDNSPETLAAWGLDGVDWMAALDMNISFDANYLQPFYERVGKTIQEEDPSAIIWYEPGASLRTWTGAGPQWDAHITRLDGIDQQVFAPHHYFDIYPFIGFNVDPREFIPEEWTYRDFATRLEEVASTAWQYLGNVPVVFGEFGTYFNFGGIEKSKSEKYVISARILDRYYEAFEHLGYSRMVWCFSPENNEDYGDGWNKEDFSIWGPDGTPRAWTAYVRPYARAASGKPVRSHFYSQHHFEDPDKGEPVPEREFVFEMESKETEAPTEVFVPLRQYPEGFYVWLSDGSAYFDADRQMLYWYPSRDEPDWTHRVAIRPPLPDQDVTGWSYFFRDDFVLNGKGGVK